MRHNRSVNQLRERGSSGATSSTYNFSINCDNTMQNKSTESTMLTSTTALSNRKQAVMEVYFYLFILKKILVLMAELNFKNGCQR